MLINSGHLQIILCSTLGLEKFWPSPQRLKHTFPLPPTKLTPSPTFSFPPIHPSSPHHSSCIPRKPSSIIPKFSPTSLTRRYSAPTTSPPLSRPLTPTLPPPPCIPHLPARHHPITICGLEPRIQTVLRPLYHFLQILRLSVNPHPVPHASAAGHPPPPPAHPPPSSRPPLPPQPQP